MAGLPRLVQPMLATLRHQLPADDDRYGWEFKWDGVRAVAYVSGNQVRLLSRNGKDMTASYPELEVLAGRVQVPAILDGEIVALHGGRPDFGVLQSRMHVRRPRARLIGSVPVQLYVFDLLYRGEDSLLGLPYTERRARLEDLGLDADPVRTPPWYPGDAEIVLATSLKHDLEGVVGKPLNSRYQPGRRRDWIKIKNVRHQELGARRLRRRPVAVRGHRGHRIHRRDAGPPRAPAGPARAGNEPVQHPGAVPVYPGRPLGGTAPGWRGRVHRADQRREHAASQLARTAHRYRPRAGAPRHQVRHPPSAVPRLARDVGIVQVSASWSPRQPSAEERNTAARMRPCGSPPRNNSVAS